MNYYFDVLKRYADFNGRARRKEFWMFILFNTIVTYTLLFVGMKLEFPLLSSLYSFAVLLPYFGVTIRRMHDVGKSGWFCIVPFYNLYLACCDSEFGQNEYGENPKGLGNDEIHEIGLAQE